MRVDFTNSVSVDKIIQRRTRMTRVSMDIGGMTLTGGNRTKRETCHEGCHPRCILRLTRMEYMYLSNTTSFLGTASLCTHTSQPPNTYEISCPPHLPPPLYTAHNKSSIQPEDGHCQASKHVVVPYVIYYLHTSTNK